MEAGDRVIIEIVKGKSAGGVVVKLSKAERSALARELAKVIGLADCELERRRAALVRERYPQLFALVEGLDAEQLEREGVRR